MYRSIVHAISIIIIIIIITFILYSCDQAVISWALCQLSIICTAVHGDLTISTIISLFLTRMDTYGE